jgi:putative thioredoxin
MSPAPEPAPATGPRAAPPQSQAQSPVQSPAQPPSEWVVEATAANLERDVLARSLQVPVLLDFWATWCGPCKTLGPELERRAREGQGRFLLAKVDIDRNPELAQAFRVQAVPTVLAVVQGRIVDGFQGALPEKELDEFLARIAPGGPAPSRADLLVEHARAMAEDGELEQAIGHLREVLREAPEHREARVLLTELLIQAGKPREARLVLEKLAGDGKTTGAEADALQALRTKLDFAETAGDVAELEARAQAAPDDLGARIELARARIAAGENERGLAELLEVVRADQGAHRAEAKKAMLEVFAMLGLEDKLANEYRFKLSLELFS